MAYTQKPNTGSIFKNERMRDGKDDPEYTGSAMIEGQEFWIDCWIKNDKRAPDYDPNKKTSFSLRFRPKGAPSPSKRADEAPRREDRPSSDRQRAAPPPPLRQASEPERQLDPVNPKTGEYEWGPNDK